jgi:hypothetical protein
MLLRLMCLSVALLAQGKLPKGEMPAEEGGEKAEDAPVDAAEASAAEKTSTATSTSTKTGELKKKKKGKRRNCFLDLAEPPGSNGHFSADGKTGWLLVAVEGDPKAGKSKKSKKKESDKGEADKTRYVLYKISPKTKKGDPVLSLEHRPNASIIAHGDPVEAVSLVAFAGKAAGCLEGPASLVSIALSAKDGDAVQGKGQYQLVFQPDGMTVSDMKKSQILQMDAESFQTKNARKVPANERPLFFDPESKKLVSWYDDGDKRGLIAHAGSSDDAKRLEVKKGDRVLQNGAQFGVAHMDPVANTIEILEVKDWSGVDKPGKFKLTVPPAYGVVSAGVHINFKKRLALVQGANFLAKTRWQRLFIYDYRSAEPLTVVPVTNKQYINFAGIDPTGSWALVEMRDAATRKTENVRLYDFATNNFADVQLEAPK